jgi:hypothetical protein
MKMPPEFRGHRFFNFRRISCNHFAFIRSFADLLVSFTLLLVSFALLLVNSADLLVSSVSESISYIYGFYSFHFSSANDHYPFAVNSSKASMANLMMG